MRDPWIVIKYPILSEKSVRLQQEQNSYTFAVDRSANKNEIKHAVETIYNVKVQSVQTMIVKGKRKRMRNLILMGKRKDWKKAYVKLKEGYRLDII
jgi:large subunit ribosomal protein L23